MIFRLNGAATAFSFAALLSLPALFAPAPAFAQVQEGQLISGIEVKGWTNTNPDVIRLAIADAGIKEGGVYHADAIAQARTAILAKGLYTDVYIKANATPDHKVNLSFEVFENPKVVLVRIKTNVPLNSKGAPDPDKIRETLESKPGFVVNVNAVRADAKAIQDVYRKAGYDAYLSELEDVFDAKTGVLTFPVTITVVNAIKVTGLSKTKPFVVLREMRTKPGDPLNRNVIQKDITHIYGTNLFADVQNPQLEVVDEGKANIVIPVTEQRTGQVQVGFGYSAEQRLTGTLSITENNFRGRGEGLSASWTVGGIVSRSQFDLGFTEPWVDRHHTSFSIDLYDRIEYRFNRIFTSTLTNGTSSNPYYEERQGATMTLSRPVTEDTRIFATLRQEAITANNLFSNYQALSIDSLNSLQGSVIQDGVTTSVAFRSLTNTRDNERDPANGYWVSPSVELGTARFHYQKPYLNPDYISPIKTPTTDKVLSTTNYQTGLFQKLNLDVRRYLNISGTPRVNVTDPKKVLATHLLLGTATGNIGFSEQYFIGGADTLRGYNDDRFWGNHLFLFSNELRIPVANHGDVAAVLFVDVGDAWGATAENSENVSGYEQHSGFSPHIGYGPGIRIRTPVGPVRLDLGFGETTRTHFSIGQAF